MARLHYATKQFPIMFTVESQVLEESSVKGKADYIYPTAAQRRVISVIRSPSSVPIYPSSCKSPTPSFFGDVENRAALRKKSSSEERADEVARADGVALALAEDGSTAVW